MIGIGLGFGKGRAGLGRYGAGSWVPTLVLDYKRGVYISAPAPTVTRPGTATYTAADGSIVAASVDTPRFDYRGAGGVLNSSARWLLVEGGSTNIAWPSQSPVTKTVTVTAGSWTVSWFGTGTVTLSGVATGSATGTGALVLTKFTATATAGSLTYTVSGDVQELQIESGTTATSRIRTTTASVPRSADAVSAIDLTGTYSYGPELVTNGDFSAGLTGWTQVLGAVTATGGRLRVARSGGGQGRAVSAGFTCVVGKTYRVTMNAYVGTLGTADWYVGISPTSSSGNIANNSTATDAVVSFLFTATQTTHYIGLQASFVAADGLYAEYDNVSVREITTPSLGVALDCYLDGVAGSTDRLVQMDAGSDTGARVVAYYDRTNARLAVEVYNASNVLQGSAVFATVLPSRVKLAIRYSTNIIQAVCNGSASAIDTSADFAAPQYVRIGTNTTGTQRPARMGVAQLLIGPAMTEAEAIILGAAA